MRRDYVKGEIARVTKAIRTQSGPATRLDELAALRHELKLLEAAIRDPNGRWRGSQEIDPLRLAKDRKAGSTRIQGPAQVSRMLRGGSPGLGKRS